MRRIGETSLAAGLPREMRGVMIIREVSIARVIMLSTGVI